MGDVGNFTPTTEKHRYSPENCEADIDEQVSAAAGYYKDTSWGN
jgi:hypothetical protein